MAEAVRRDARDDLFLDDDENEDTQANKYMFFRIADESYGIGIRHILEIIELQRISQVPDMPPYVKGVINLRGKVIPVVDLRLRFGLPERVYDDRTCIVVADVSRIMLGFIVDTVEEVIEIAVNTVEEAPKFRTQSGKDRYISGMGKVGEDVKILLDVETLVRDEDVQSIAKAEGSA